MSHQRFKPDLTGSDESLEHLLDRLRSFNLRRPPKWDAFVTSRRPPRGTGGAEAPIPRETPPADLYAS